MKNIPKNIWLHVGEDTPDDADFDELLWGEISWNSVKLENNAIRYVNLDYIISLLREKYCSSLVDCILEDLNKEWRNHNESYK